MMQITDKKKLFQMKRTASMENLKTLAGEVVRPVCWMFNEYTDSDGTVHNVLALELEGKGFFRTEARAFLESFAGYDEAFRDEEVKPAFRITSKASKRGNPYINFELTE